MSLGMQSQQPPNLHKPNMSSLATVSFGIMGFTQHFTISNDAFIYTNKNSLYKDVAAPGIVVPFIWGLIIFVWAQFARR